MEFVQQSVTTVKQQQYKRQIIAEAIKQNIDKLFRTICIYVRKSGIATGSEIQKVATECLSEVVERGLRHADRFDPDRKAEAWLLGIAAKVILQEKQKQNKNKIREPFLQDLIAKNETGTIDDLMGRLLPNKPYMDDTLASQDQYQKLMECVPKQDQELLQMSIIQNYSAKEIAEHLGSTPGAIRVRLFRALKRLRNTLEQKEKYELLVR